MEGKKKLLCGQRKKNVWDLNQSEKDAKCCLKKKNIAKCFNCTRPPHLHFTPWISSPSPRHHARNHSWRSPSSSSPRTQRPSSPHACRKLKVGIGLQNVSLHRSPIRDTAHTCAWLSRRWSPVGIDAALGDGRVVTRVAGVGARSLFNGFVRSGMFDVRRRALTAD